ncbi:MAG: hypothetical protein AABY22_16320 [Nanoarchaeota archaeon]
MKKSKSKSWKEGTHISKTDVLESWDNPNITMDLEEKEPKIGSETWFKEKDWPEFYCGMAIGLGMAFILMFTLFIMVIQ